MSKIEAVAIVKLLIPRIDKEKKLSSYKNRGPCIDWLMDNPGWESEMDNAAKEVDDIRRADQPKLFEISKKEEGAEC